MRRPEALEALLQSCESAIRDGALPRAREALNRLNTAQISRPLRLPFATLCRRSGLNELGLKIVSPCLETKTTVNERAEYAVLLQRIGVIEESLKILRSISPNELPSVLLYQAYCHFNRWEYHEAIPLLRTYIEAKVSAYDKLVGRVNLAAALVACGEFSEALPLLENIKKETAEGNFSRLAANALEIQTQAHHFSNEPELARQCLMQSQAILKGEKTSDEISVRKWQAVLQAHQENSPAALVAISEFAFQSGDWETFRNIDLHRLKVEFNEDLFHFHLFGSPWIAYRELAQRWLGRVNQRDSLIIGTGGEILKVKDGGMGMSEGVHRALEALTRDFYRPTPVGALFSILFQNEHFDAFSSPNRVHQAVFKLRRWIALKKLPIEIELVNEAYTLKLNAGLRLELPYLRRTPSGNNNTLQILRESFKDSGCFTLKQGATACGLSTAAFRSFIQWALDHGHIRREGAGSSTIYEIIAPGGLRRPA